MNEKLYQFEHRELSTVQGDVKRLQNENKKLKIDYYRMQQQLKKKGALEFIDDFN